MILHPKTSSPFWDHALIPYYSPCWLTSRPMTSSSVRTRNGTKALIALRMTKVSAGPNQRDHDAVSLRQQLPRITFEQAGDTLRRVGSDRQRGDREHAGEQCAGEATDAVDAKDVERVVVTDLGLEPGTSPEAERAGDHRSAPPASAVRNRTPA